VTWIIGGALLIAAPLVSLALAATPSFGAVLFAAALLVFALAPGSVTQRRPLGTAALILLAVWCVAAAVISSTLVASTAQDDFTAPLVFAYVDSGVQLVLAVIAVVQIARSATIPRPWNWSPAWALLLMVLAWLVVQVASVTVGSSASIASGLSGIEATARIASCVFLGVVAIVFAARAPRVATSQHPTAT
jgi:hypothetical protein